MFQTNDNELLHKMERIARSLEKLTTFVEKISIHKHNRDEKRKILERKKLEYNILQYHKDLSASVKDKEEYEKETSEWLGEVNYHLPEFTEEDEKRMKELEKEIKLLEKEIENDLFDW